MAKALKKGKSERKTVSIFYLEELGDECLGLKLLVECIEETYLGVLNHFFKLDGRLALWLEQVVIPRLGERCFGLRKINASDIESISIVGVDKSAKKRLMQEIYGSSRKPNLLMRKVIPLEEIDDDEDEEILSSTPALSYEELLREVQDGTSCVRLPSRRILVEQLGDNFDQAIEHITNEELIGIHIEGMDLGRSGNIGWLCVSTRDVVYLFDVARITIDQCLQNGFKRILINEKIEKVILDSRELQDYLHYNHQCGVVNPFDLLAADINLHVQISSGEVPCLLKDLGALLQDFLDHKNNILVKYLPERDLESTGIWFERPLSNDLVNSLTYSVIFLKELRERMLNLILRDLKEMTATFQNSYAKKSFDDVKQTEKSIVPVELQSYKPCFNSKIKYKKERRRRRHR